MTTPVYSRKVVIWALQVAADAAFRSRKNSGFDAKVLVAISAHADSTGEFAWLGQKRIAAIVYGVEVEEVTDSQVRSVRRSIAFLQDQGCLVVEKGAKILANGRAVNGYHLAYVDVEVVQGELLEEER